MKEAQMLKPLETKEIKNGPIRITELLRFDAKQEASLLLVGYYLYQQGRIEDARRVFEGLALLDGTNPYVHGILGSIYQKQEKYNIALERYTMALNLFPEDMNSLVNRAEVFLKLGKFLEAFEDFKKVILLDPEQKNSAANRARLMVVLTQDVLNLAKQKGLDAVLAEKNRVNQLASKGL